MKKFKFLYIFLITVLLVGSCKQEPIVAVDPTPPVTGAPPVKGTADFTKFIAVGNSFVAGVQAGALFTEGQNNSLPAIMAKQFAVAGVGGGAFVQPTINATLGYNLFVTPNPGSDNRIIGRLLLQGASPKPTPQLYALGNLEAAPNPAVNPAFIYTGGKATLNNFGVAAITVGQSLITATGNWANPNPAVGFSPFYARLAPPPGGTTTIIGDAVASGGSFFMLWLGLDDFFLYAAFGGDPTKAPLNSSAAFAGQYGAAVNTILTNTSMKGVIANFPDIFVMPHFTSVTYNAIPLDAATAASVTSSFAVNYNGFLDQIAGLGAITAAEAAVRKVTYVAGQNKILITDETLTDLTPYMAGPAAGLLPYARARQTTSADILPLSSGSVLGTLVGGDPTKVNGVSVPLADQYCLIPTEIAAIRAARDAFNSTVAGTAASNASRLALADVSAAMATLVTNQAAVMNGVTITPNINPPTGIYSEDGVHPNSRGYAFLSTVFISAINAKFGSTVPLTDISLYKATALPIP